MKKIVLCLITVFIFANFAIAQVAEAEVAEAAPVGITFFDIVASSGGVGSLAWIALFTMWPVGIILGITSSIYSGMRKNTKLPLSFKWLMIAPVIYLFIGAGGVMWGMIGSIATIETQSGAAKASALAMSLSNSLYLAGVTMLGMIPFIFFIILSVIILHAKKVPNTLETTQNAEDGS